MRDLRRFLLLIALLPVALLLIAALSLPLAAQDEGPSLGDVARQARLQKQKNAPSEAKDTQPTDAQNVPGQDVPGKEASPKDAQTPVAASAKDSSSAAGTAVSSKDPSGKNTTAKGPKKVVTNDEIPEHVGPTSTRPEIVKAPGTPDSPNYDPGKVPAAYWKNQIMALKQSILALESQIQDVSDSIRYSGGGCVSNCVLLNQQQQQKQQQVEMMTSQLSQEQKSLEAMQEMARKQGYNSAVYDP